MRLKSGAESFGVVIAFLAPGFVALWGASYHVVIIREWLSIREGSAPVIGGFLFITLASIATGVAVSGFRWVMIDTLWCGICKAKKYEFNFKNLPGREDAFSLINENHYRYYLYYANMLIAVLITYVSRFFARCFQEQDLLNKREFFLLVAMFIVEIVLGIGAWDARRKFYERGKDILSD